MRTFNNTSTTPRYQHDDPWADSLQPAVGLRALDLDTIDPAALQQDINNHTDSDPAQDQPDDELLETPAKEE